jgi:archaellum biogenesis ATPase FlaH
MQVSSESIQSPVSVQVSSPEYLLPRLHGIVSQLEGLVEIYGQSSTGKTRMCVQMAKDAMAQGYRTLYVTISKASCLEFLRATGGTDAAVVTSAHALLELLTKVRHQSPKWPVVIVEGLSPILFEMEDRAHTAEMCIELQAALRALSQSGLVILTFNLSPEGSSFVPVYWHQNTGVCFYLERQGDSTKVTVLRNSLVTVELQYEQGR